VHAFARQPVIVEGVLNVRLLIGVVLALLLFQAGCNHPLEICPAACSIVLKVAEL
jgi:hypothetical protein